MYLNVQRSPTATSQHSDLTSFPRLLTPPRPGVRQERADWRSRTSKAAGRLAEGREGAEPLGERLRECWCKSGYGYSYQTLGRSYEKVVS